MMPVAQYALNLGLGGEAGFLGLGRDHGILQPFISCDLFLYRGVRHDDDVVLIAAHGNRRTFNREHPDNVKRQLVNAYRLPYGIGVAKQVLAYRIANDGYVVGGLYIVLGEVCAFGQRPDTNIQIVGLGAGNARIPVVIAEDDLRRSSGAGGYWGDRRAFAPNGPNIVVKQGLWFSPTPANP